MSQKALAELVGVSPETIRGYERGTRSPTRVHLRQLIHALELPEAEANQIVDELGLALGKRRTLFPSDRFPDYFFTVGELQEYVETVPWPRFVLNNLGEVVAVNKAAQALWQIDFQAERVRRTQAQLNLLSIASEARFAQRMANWDECVATVLAVLKGKPDNPGSLEEPTLYLQQVLAEFAKHDPSYLPRLFTLWQNTPPREAKVQWSYRVDWNDPHAGLVRFTALVSTVNEPDALGLNDWIPMDAATWTNLESVKNR